MAKSVKFKCVGDKCKAPRRLIHLGPIGTMVDLEAVKTDVVLRFVDKSPFDTKQVSIPEDDTRTREVVNKGHFEYKVSCSKCKKKGLRPALPPQFIVP